MTADGDPGEVRSSKHLALDDLAQYERPRRIRVFTDRYDWMGPFIVALSSWYFLAQIVVAWMFNPGQTEYSFVSNTISDLGNTACYGASYHNVCSPRHALMNASFIALGAAMVVCSWLIYTEFDIPKRVRGQSRHATRESWAAKAGFLLMGIGGIGSVIVGSSPENVNSAAHITGAIMAIGGGDLAIVVLGVGLLVIPEGMRQYMVIAGSVAIVAAVSFGLKHHFGLGAGGMERIAQYPQTIWLIMLGLYISRNHYLRGITGRYFRFTTDPPWRHAGV
jgi:hypothetical membrane protein